MKFKILSLLILSIGFHTATVWAENFGHDFARVVSVMPQDDDTVSGVGEKVDLQCDGKPISISGSDNEVKLVGVCPKVIVSGTNNVVHIDQALRITVSGADNSITYKSAIKRKYAIVSKSGSGNSVRKN